MLIVTPSSPPFECVSSIILFDPGVRHTRALPYHLHSDDVLHILLPQFSITPRRMET
jgi:hypothetical protein